MARANKKQDFNGNEYIELIRDISIVYEGQGQETKNKLEALHLIKKI
jgi:hypothetical protein